jgi:hypothetical protein
LYFYHPSVVEAITAKVGTNLKRGYTQYDDGN